VQVTDEREVPLVIHELLSDKKVAKAAHPAIFAYRIKRDVGGAAGVVYNTGKSDKMVPGQVWCTDFVDYDDDGESQAGARLKHLLEILELDNVLVVVSRWYGGTLLGADRFKHINQAARDALELGGFLAEKEKETKGKKGKKW
jgi:putative IMPACT (imprinted ancient) family translation regulator